MPRFEDHFLDDLRHRVSLSDVVGRVVTWHKKTRRAAGDYWAPCPFHGEKTPSFHVLDKRGRYKCFGCGVAGDHFRFLMEHDGLSFPDAVAEVASLAGVSIPDARPPTEEEKRERARRAAEREKKRAADLAAAEQERAQRTMSAALIWKQTVPLAGTPGERYLEWRCPGLCPPPGETEVRFHPKLEIDPDRPTGDSFPAIVSRVSDVNGKGIAVWRIYLKPDGMPLTDRDGAKIKRAYGPAAGGACRLGGVADTIGLCEGVETARAIALLGVGYPVWPALSTSGIIGFQIPAAVKRVVCYPDPDGSKLKTKHRKDGTAFIAQPPGQEAVRRFREANPDRDIRMAETAWDSDYLEVAQKMLGVPVR